MRACTEGGKVKKMELRGVEEKDAEGYTTSQTKYRILFLAHNDSTLYGKRRDSTDL